MPAMMVVIVVGMLIGTWMASGAIPMMIYYGLKIISPSFYLVTACVVCSIISVVTGTSYGTAGTVGVAFIGIAQGLDIPLPQAAGAIVAGSYFGDKLSPFSDTTNLAPIASGSNLFDHIKHMLWTTTPACLLGLFLYFLLGLGGGVSGRRRFHLQQHGRNPALQRCHRVGSRAAAQCAAARQGLLVQR